MLRYFVIAAIVVVGIFVGVTVHYRYRLPINVGSGRATMPPHASSSAPPSAHAERGLHGQAPWALSALPECMIQTDEWKGSFDGVRAHLPRNARAVHAWSVLHYGDCTIFVSHDQALVHRGDDWLQIPPIAHLYTFAGAASEGVAGVALIRSSCEERRCGSVLRLYTTKVPK